MSMPFRIQEKRQTPHDIHPENRQFKFKVSNFLLDQVGCFTYYSHKGTFELVHPDLDASAPEAMNEHLGGQALVEALLGPVKGVADVGEGNLVVRKATSSTPMAGV